jgi:phosphatidylglycerol:prolipoprotein diacylglycerol transferase
MRPIPIFFHIGPLQIHTYGIGLAITFVFAAWYLGRRFKAAGYPWRWAVDASFWIIIAAILGARVAQVVSQWSFYSAHPGQIVAIWNGGLSSFGGLLFGVPTGLVLMRRRCPEVSISRGLDLAAPVLAAGWGVGRLLGPQLMLAGGGRRTTAWYGMYYAGSVGRRVPVPIFQSIESFAVFGAVLLIERRLRDRPDGLLIAAAAALWGLARFFDQFFWLGTPGHIDAVEVAGVALCLAGSIAAGVLLSRHRRQGPRPPARGPAGLHEQEPASRYG